MAETNANIRIGVDTSDALTQIKNLQRQISQFHTQMGALSKTAAQESARMQSSLMKNINATGAFSAQMTTVRTATESFTNALEKNKISIGQTFRYAAGSTRTFGRLFRNEFNTIEKVATERVKDLQTQYIKLGRDASGAMKAIKIRPNVLDMQDYGTKTAIAAQKQQLFNQLIRQGSTNLLNWGKNTQWAGRQLMVGFTVPLTIFGGIAIREFQKIEEQAIKFRRVYGDMFTSTKETEKALADVRALADEFTKFGISVEKTIDLAAKVAQMGNVGQALETQVREATRLSILGGMEQQEALDTTIGLTNAFGLEIADLTEKVNFLNAAENQTILAIQDFNTAVPLAGSVVQQLGGSVEDLAFFLTAMREGGINASQGANALKSSLARLISPTKAAQERLGEMGINVLGIVEANAGDLRGTVMQLGYALDALDPLTRARAIETLFGRFQFARMSTLFQNIVDEGSQANKVLQLTTNSAEELAILADRELGRVEESAATRLSKSMEEIKAALAPIGEAFVELVVPILNIVRDMVKRFDNMGDAGKKIFLGFVAVLGVIAPALLMVVGLIANGLANLMLFGSKILSIFGKSSKSSKILTDQFTYMNSEQIEAAAIAASLNQVHSDLVQTFNAEATAVNLLVKAYDKAIARQNAMMMGRPVGAPGAAPTAAGGTGGRVPGFAKGIVSVPGPKGKGDIVPAMLSPGEAVIPTKQSQKYSALIRGIIADNIPGFAKGRDGFHSAHMAKKLDPDDPAVKKQIKEMFPGITDAQIANMEVHSDLTMDMPEWMNRKLRNSDVGIDPDRYLEASKGIKNKLLATSRAALGDVEEILKQQGLEINEASLRGLSQGLENDIQNRAAKLAKAAGTNVTDTILQQATEQVLKEAQAAGQAEGATPEQRKRGILAQGLEGRGKMIGDYRGAPEGEGTKNERIRKLIAEGRAGVRKGERGGAEVYLINEDGSLGPKIGRPSSGSSSGLKDWAANQKTNKHGVIVDESGRPIAPDNQKLRFRDTTTRVSTVGGRQGYGYRTSEVEVTDPKSLSEDGKTTAAAAEETAKTEKKRGESNTKNAKATDNNTKAIEEDTKATKKKTGAVQKQTKDSAKPAGPAGGWPGPLKKDGSPDMRSKANQEAARLLNKDGSPDMRRRENREAAKNVERQRRIDSQKMKDYGTTGEITPEMRQRRRAALAREKQLKREVAQAKAEVQLLKQKQKTTTGLEREVKRQGIVERLKQRATDRRQQRLNREATQATQDAAQQVPRRGPGMGMGGAGMIGMASSMVMMGASFAPGKLGEAAGKLFPAMMAVSMALPMMRSGIGIVVVALAALAAGVFFLNKSFTDAMKEGEALAKAFGAGRESMEAFAEAAGKVTASQIMDRRREEQAQGFRIQPGKSTFGETFLEGDMGEEMLNNLRAAVERTGSLDAVKSAVVNQLGTAIATGALDAGQARSIVAKLASELGDYQFGIEVNGQLLSMFGPDGQDLLKEPLEIRLRLMEETRGQLQNMAEEALFPAGQASRERGAVTLPAGAAAGSGVGALAGLTTDFFSKQGGAMQKLATRMLPGVVARIGASAAVGSALPIVGTVIGAVAGVGLAAWDLVKFQKELGQAAGGVVATSALALQQNQQLLDSLEIEYERRIQIAREAGNAAEAARLENQYLEDRQALLQGNRETMDAILEAYSSASTGFLGIGNERAALDKAMDEQLKKLYEDEPLIQAFLDQTMRDVDRSLSGELGYQIKVSLLSKDISPTVISQLLATFQDDEESIQRAMNVVTNLGTADGNLALGIMNMFETPEQSARFIANVEMKDPNAAKEYVELFQEIAKVGEIQDLEVVMAFYLDNPQEAANLQRDLERIQEISENGDVTLDVYASVFADTDAQRALLEYSEEFEQLQPEYRTDFVQAFRTIYETIELTPGALENWRRETGRSDATAADMAASEALRLTQSKMSAGVMADIEPDEDLGGGGGGGPQASPLDELLKKLRDLRKAQIEVTKGWVESRNAIDRLFGGGKEIKVFEGIEQQMRRIGAGEDLISLIVGMDPDDYERRKNELFVFDAEGNIAGATTALVNMGKALRAVALGEFQSEQQRVIQGLNEQMIAFRKLTAAGLSAAQAYDAVKNAAFAAAIAREKDNSVIRETIRLTKQAIELQRAFNAAQSLATRNEQAGDLRGVVSFIERNAKSLTEAQKSAILSDPDLQTLIMNPRVDPKTLREALRNAERQADLDLRINKLTFEGLTTIFQNGFSNAMEAFATKEREIDIAFNLKKDPFLKIIQAAEEEISDIRNREGGLDDLEAELTRISRQEEDINKAYDRRLEALDRIDKINEQINRQQKSQLDVADALSRGDIAAAARAAQEARKEAAEAAQKERREQLEAARQSDLSKVTGRMGLNREAIEEKIRDLQLEIFNIEEDRLEPAQRQVELLERERSALVESLTVLGKTRKEWEALENQVALAKISSDSFKKSMQDALDVVEDIINYWDEFDNKEIDLFVNVKGMGALEELLAIAEAGPPTPDPGSGGGGGGSEGPDVMSQFRGQRVGPGIGDRTGDVLAGMKPAPTGQPYTLRQAEQADEARIRAQGLRQEADAAKAELDDLEERAARAPGNKTLQQWVQNARLAYHEAEGLAADAEQTANDLANSLSEKMAAWELGDPFSIFNTGAAVSIGDAFATMLERMDRDANGVITGNIAGYLMDLGIRASTIMETFPGFLDYLGDVKPEQLNAIASQTQGFFNTLAANVGASIGTIGDVLGKMPEEATAKMGADILAFSNEITTLPETWDAAGLTSWWSTLSTEAKKALNEGDSPLAKAMLDLGEQSVNDLQGTLGTFWELLPEGIGEIFEDEITPFIAEQAEAMGLSMDEFLLTTLTEMPENIKDDWSSGFADRWNDFSVRAVMGIRGAENALNNLDDAIEGPKIAKSIGDALRGGLAEGEEKYQEVLDYIASLGSDTDVVAALEKDYPDLVEKGAQIAVENLDEIPEKISQTSSDPRVQNDVNNRLPNEFGNSGRASGDRFGSSLVARIEAAIRAYRPTPIVIPVRTEGGVNTGGMIMRYALGGQVAGYAMGGAVSRYASGGSLPMNRVVPGTANYDKVQTLLTPGEFVIRKESVKKYGRGLFEQLNSGIYNLPKLSSPSFSVDSPYRTTDPKAAEKSKVMYNNSYQVNVNVKSDANPEQIARTVTDHIKRVESQKIRGNRF